MPSAESGKACRPAARRDALGRTRTRERCGSRLMNMGRSVVRYQAKPKADGALRERLKELAERYLRYGYPALHAMLRHEGLVKNTKHT